MYNKTHGKQQLLRNRNHQQDLHDARLCLGDHRADRPHVVHPAAEAVALRAARCWEVVLKFELMYDDGSGDAYLWDAFTSEESAAWALAGLVSNGVTYRDFK